MHLLLDTHIFLWWLENNPRLSSQMVRAIQEAERVCFSAVSAWEISIKIAKGLLTLSADVEEGITRNGFEPLPVRVEHALEVRHLPLHHHDPFDRMLVAQARVELLVLASNDQKLQRYHVPLLTG